MKGATERIDDREIRFLGDLQRLQLKPGEKLVLRTKERLSAETCERLSTNLRLMLGDDVPVIVLDGGLQMGVIGPHATNARIVDVPISSLLGHVTLKVTGIRRAGVRAYIAQKLIVAAAYVAGCNLDLDIQTKSDATTVA